MPVRSHRYILWPLPHSKPAWSGVRSFTELPQVIGEGVTGKRLGTHVWPGKSVLMFTVVSDEKKDELVAALRECQKNLFPGEGMKAFVLPAEEAL